MLNQFLWLKHPPKMVVVEVVSLVVVIGVGKLSAIGHQCKFRNFEKFGAILGQSGRTRFLEAMQRMV